MDNDDNGTGPTNRQACAACKHQRKKCAQQCLLSPFFPAEKNQQFQAVHKLFGVSNVTKLLKSLRFEERKQAIDSLIWEAQCRESDPILGCYGEYSRIVNELQLLKNQQQQQQQQQQQEVIVAATQTDHAENMMNNKPFVPLIDYPYHNNNNNGINGAGVDTAVVNYNNNINSNNGYLQRGFFMEPIHGYVPEQEKRFQRRDGNNVVSLPNSFNQSYYHDSGKL